MYFILNLNLRINFMKLPRLQNVMQEYIKYEWGNINIDFIQFYRIYIYFIKYLL